MKAEPEDPHLARQAIQVLAATLIVAVTPVVLVWCLRASGALPSPELGIAVGMAASLFLSLLARVLWERSPDSEDLLFSELMIWGFLHRLLSERRLANARDIVGELGERRRAALDRFNVKERAKLLEQLVFAMETRDPYLHGHSRRVARHSWMIAKRMGLSREDVARVRLAAAVHDVGKTKTPTAILHKPAALSDKEYEIIKLHPGDGAVMVSVLHDELLAAMVRHHHERLDGSGYPDGLTGEEIPLGARIIAVADTFDAISSARPYRAARPHQAAMDILRQESGTRLDPNVVKAFNGHYAGQGPIALWSLLTSLPGRIISSFGGSVASVAAAAKVVAIAALVGGAASTPASIAETPHGSGRAAPDVREASIGARALAGFGGSTLTLRSPVRRGEGSHQARPAKPKPSTILSTPRGTGAPPANSSPVSGTHPSGGATPTQPPDTHTPRSSGGSSEAGREPSESAPSGGEEAGGEAPKSRPPGTGGKSEEAPGKVAGPPPREEKPAKEEKPPKEEKPVREEKPAKTEEPGKGPVGKGATSEPGSEPPGKATH